MKYIYRLYRFFLEIGQKSNYSSVENKRIKLLNIYILITFHFVVIMPIGDILTGILTLEILVCYFLMSIVMVFILLLNKYHHYYWATIIWLATVLFSVFMFSVVLLPESYSEYYYVFVPGIALTLFNKNTIPAIITLLSLFLFLIPYYIIVVYPISVVNKLDVFAVLGLFVCVYLLVNYFKKINIDNEIKLKEAYKKLEATKKDELTNLQLKLLRGRMNPHFLFNTMNSVQNLVIKGNTMDTYMYLSKFSAVIRGNLKMSEKTHIFFEEEFSLLEKYLELEKLRFKDSVEYVLEKGNTMSGVQIPSMVIQPFVENSLYRMFHKADGFKKINIHFTQNLGVVSCTILDTGISFKEMNTIQNNHLKKDSSFSLESINQHLELLKELYKIDIDFDYKINEGETICSLKIPYKN